MHEEHLSPELKSLESKLAGLRPVAGSLDSAQLLFEAGQQAALATHATTVVTLRRQLHLWKGGFAAAATVAACLLVAPALSVFGLGVDAPTVASTTRSGTEAGRPAETQAHITDAPPQAPAANVGTTPDGAPLLPDTHAQEIAAEDAAPEPAAPAGVVETPRRRSPQVRRTKYLRQLDEMLLSDNFGGRAATASVPVRPKSSLRDWLEGSLPGAVSRGP